ncbi:hypothetical protein ABTE14_21115, partial [Acinetobacter baumannii]
FVAYSAINSGIDTRVGNVIVGLAVTAALSYALAVHYLASGYLFGIFGAVASGIVAALFTGLVVAPMAFYLANGFCEL